MKKILFETGVLLLPSDEEYNCYNNVYGGTYSFYDEEQTVFNGSEKKFETLKRTAKEGCLNGCNGSYAVISEQYSDARIDRLDTLYYGEDAVIYSCCKNFDGKFIENFIKEKI